MNLVKCEDCKFFSTYMSSGRYCSYSMWLACWDIRSGLPQSCEYCRGIGHCESDGKNFIKNENVK